jgi:NAD+ diphosphatase
MLFATINQKFKFLHLPFSQPKKDDLLFCYKDNKIGLSCNNQIPKVSELIDDLSTIKEAYCFGKIDNVNCFLWQESNAKSPLNFTQVRHFCASLPDELRHAAALGNHISHWRELNHYCGKCGTTMQDSDKERARICSGCNNIVYPRISPCVMALIIRGEQILLARSPHFPQNKLSVLAGFINPGETAEQAVIREIKEEVGLEVNNLKYICSQPWPFPDSLMLGFTAQYLSGEIKIDPAEIEFAGWFNKNKLPKIPDHISLARLLIDVSTGKPSSVF